MFKICSNHIWSLLLALSGVVGCSEGASISGSEAEEPTSEEEEPTSGSEAEEPTSEEEEPTSGSEAEEPTTPEDEVYRKWEEYVSTRRDCQTDDDCTIVSCGCPTGCGTAVSTEMKESAQTYACELVDEYEEDGKWCAYDCMELAAVCEQGNCATVVK